MLLGRQEPVRPLSRRPGSQAPIPGTRWSARLYPTQLHLQGPLGEAMCVPLPVTGCVQEWTAQLDLHHREIRIWGRSDHYFLFRIRAEEEGIFLIGERQCALRQLLVPAPGERNWTGAWLQFGSHAVQDVDRLRVRPSLQQLLPAWFLLGDGLLPDTPPFPEEASLLGELARSIASHHPADLERLLETLWRVGFSDLWMPQLRDAQFWGASLVPTLEDPWKLLSAVRPMLQQMFLAEDSEGLHLLPCLPACLPAGRLLHCPWSGGLCSLEWTKGTPRRVLLQAAKDCTIQIHGKHLTSAQIRTSHPPDRPFHKGDVVHLTAGQELLLHQIL